MNIALPQTDYATLTAPNTVRIERLLPGPIERVWAYLTDSDLRRQWMASGEMEMQVGAPFELTWHNDELTDPPGQRPDGFGKEHSMRSRITELDPPRRLAFTWGDSGGSVSFDLQPKGDAVLLTVIHRGISDRSNLLMIGAGWHTHLDILVARATGKKPMPFWDVWSRRRTEYDRHIPA